jgi:Zn-finger nucleic acid-binding protein
VKIDRCADCNGVWLDAGEMELVEHAQQSGVTKFFSSMLGRRRA